jgi:hypothetical protein
MNLRENATDRSSAQRLRPGSEPAAARAALPSRLARGAIVLEHIVDDMMEPFTGTEKEG